MHWLRSTYVLALAVPMCALLGADLPRGAERAVERYEKAVEAAMTDFVKAMEKELERATKAGDLDEALAIQAEIARVTSGAGHGAAGAAAGEGPYATPTDVEIPAASEGIDLGELSPGDRIIVQYVSGSWRAYNTWDNQSPDDAGILDQHRLAIQHSDPDGKPVRELVPCGTRRKPHAHEVEVAGTYLLRIGDPVLSSNSGSVIYKVQVAKGR